MNRDVIFSHDVHVAHSSVMQYDFQRYIDLHFHRIRYENICFNEALCTVRKHKCGQLTVKYIAVTFTR